jgi:hypothetical protein
MGRNALQRSRSKSRARQTVFELNVPVLDAPCAHIDIVVELMLLL